MQIKRGGNKESIYDSIVSASYDMSGLTIKGGMDGGCFTCPQGRKKIENVYKMLAKNIPKYFKQYKSSCEKPKKRATKTKGGYSWFSSDCDKCNESKSEVFNQKFSSDLLNTNDLDFGSKNEAGIYTIDQTFGANTSVFGML